MASNVGSARRDMRYEPDERPPNLLSLGLGLQHAMIVIPGIVLSPAILIQSAGGSEAYVMWAVCTALAICGVTTAVQAMPVGRIGAGYVMMMGTSGAFLAISVSALEQGGPGLLATLIIVSSLFQFALAARLSALRRIFTPTVAGTVVMLIPVTLSPIAGGEGDTAVLEFIAATDEANLEDRLAVLSEQVAGARDGAGGVAAAAAALCLVGATQPVPRHRRGHGSRGSGRRPVSRPACWPGDGDARPTSLRDGRREPKGQEETLCDAS